MCNFPLSSKMIKYSKSENDNFQLNKEVKSYWIGMCDKERITLRDSLNKPVIDWVLPGLPVGSVGAIVGPGGVGKSFLSIAIAAVIGCGFEMGGNMFKSKNKGKVVIFFGEDPKEIVQDRLHSFRNILNNDEIELFDVNVKIVSGHGIMCQLMGLHGNYGEFYDVFLEAAKGARLLILDPFSRLHGADENDNSAMTRMLQILESISKKTGASILVIHHTGKMATSNFNGEMKNQSASRGASALSSGLRWQVNMWIPNKKELSYFGVKEIESKFFVKISLVKANYTRLIDDQWMQRGNNGVLQYVKLDHDKKNIIFCENEMEVSDAISDEKYYFD